MSVTEPRGHHLPFPIQSSPPRGQIPGPLHQRRAVAEVVLGVQVLGQPEWDVRGGDGTTSGRPGDAGGGGAADGKIGSNGDEETSVNSCVHLYLINLL